MLTKHFFKILVIFIGMIILGLIGVYLASNMDIVKGESSVLKSMLAPK